MQAYRRRCCCPPSPKHTHTHRHTHTHTDTHMYLSVCPCVSWHSWARGPTTTTVVDFISVRCKTPCYCRRVGSRINRTSLQRSLLSHHANWSRITLGFESIVCARLPPLQETLNQELQIADIYWVCRSCLVFSVDAGRGGGRPTWGCEQQEVAGVCEKAAVPVVIYTYRRAIV